jgi:hypothetical protein
MKERKYCYGLYFPNYESEKEIILHEIYDIAIYQVEKQDNEIISVKLVEVVDIYGKQIEKSNFNLFSTNLLISFDNIFTILDNESIKYILNEDIEFIAKSYADYKNRIFLVDDFELIKLLKIKIIKKNNEKTKNIMKKIVNIIEKNDIIIKEFEKLEDKFIQYKI